MKPLAAAYLEGHVLQEVGDAIVLRVLVPRPGVDPEADSGGRRIGAPTLCGHADPIVQHGQVGRRRVNLCRDRRGHHAWDERLKEEERFWKVKKTCWC